MIFEGVFGGWRCGFVKEGGGFVGKDGVIKRFGK
jgi:hypothetical protein